MYNKLIKCIWSRKMNIKRILSCFLIVLPVCVAARFFQIIKTIDFANGFFIPSEEILGYLLLLVMLLACVIMTVISLGGKESFETAPKTNLLLGVSSGFVASRLFVELFGEVMSFAMPPWHVLIVKFVTVFTAIYFSVLFLQSLLKFKIPPMLHIIPAIYAVVKTIFTFINISALSIISDNVLLMASYCVLMIFFINYARLYNNIDAKKAGKKVVCYGFIAATLCITCSLPTIIINLFSETDYLHSNISVGNTLLTIGCFIVVFVCEYFYNWYKKEEHI